MIRLLASGAVIGGIWMAYAAPAEDAVRQQQEPARTGPVLEWRLSGRDMPEGKPCTIRLRDGAGDSAYRLSAAPDCADMAGTLAAARIWREDANGAVLLEDENGHRVAEFGPAEFEGLVSVYPSHMDLALLPAD